jgi:hypothetical protein
MQVDSERRRSALALLHMATNVKHTTERAWHLRGVTTIVGVVAIALATPLPAAAQKWPAAEWQVAVIATTDNVHEDGGEATLDDAEATLIAGGDDIWNNADQFTFLYKEISGDFDVAVVVQSIEFTNEWAKAGIMARQTLEPGSINVLAAARAQDDLVTFQRRDSADGASASERFTPDGASFPTGIRLIKEGDVFSGDWGEGTTWSGDPVTKDGATSTPPIELELSDPYYLGIAVTSHAAGTLTEAVVDVINDTPMAVDPNGKLATTWGAIRDVR